MRERDGGPPWSTAPIALVERGFPVVVDVPAVALSSAGGLRARVGGEELVDGGEVVRQDLGVTDPLGDLRAFDDLPLVAPALGDAVPPARIDPEKLNEVDKRILKAAFRQAALLQERLRMDFGL